MKATFTVVSLLAFVSVLAPAQTKVSGTVDCAAPDKANTIEVGAKRTFTINQGKCTWSKPIDFGVAQMKEDVVTQFIDQSGDRNRAQGVAMSTLSNGDTMEIRLQATGTTKDGKMTSEGKWTIGKGTGKAKGLTGGGTFKCSGTQDKLSCEVEGEYPAAPKEAKKDAKK